MDPVVGVDPAVGACGVVGVAGAADGGAVAADRARVSTGRASATDSSSAVASAVPSPSSVTTVRVSRGHPDSSSGARAGAPSGPEACGPGAGYRGRLDAVAARTVSL
ncbi:hypothetical protein ACWDPI_26885, partial [Streptomyces zhihengii]